MRAASSRSWIAATTVGLRAACTRPFYPASTPPARLSAAGVGERRRGATELERDLHPPGAGRRTTVARAVGFSRLLDPEKRVDQRMSGARRRRDAQRLAARVAPLRGFAAETV